MARNLKVKEDVLQAQIAEKLKKLEEMHKEYLRVQTIINNRDESDPRKYSNKLKKEVKILVGMRVKLLQEATALNKIRKQYKYSDPQIDEELDKIGQTLQKATTTKAQFYTGKVGARGYDAFPALPEKNENSMILAGQRLTIDIAVTSKTIKQYDLATNKQTGNLVLDLLEKYSNLSNLQMDYDAKKIKPGSLLSYFNQRMTQASSRPGDLERISKRLANIKDKPPKLENGEINTELLREIVRGYLLQERGKFERGTSMTSSLKRVLDDLLARNELKMDSSSKKIEDSVAYIAYNKWKEKHPIQAVPVSPEAPNPNATTKTTKAKVVK